MSRLMPRQKTPDLSVNLVGGGTWSLAKSRPEHFTMIVAYRGLHCPICQPYLREADRTLGEFAQRGVEVVAVSSDTRERAEQTRNDWGLKALPVGYGLSIDSAREWGLYVSTSRGKTSTGVMEPELFSEPGLFLVRPDQTLYAASYATMPFARPHFSELLKALDFIIANDYPARGEA
ncbi:MAG: AhpC/TSA family protein [Proteobacteria bacterium]|nr:MAG: AhpC/TSA family protein [Pseudomonadota bacterium]QKK12371.1 MAG: AhpC/TSA family protein [Pseudomonadota bacterium]